MESYIKGEITITAAQLAKTAEDIKAEMHKSVWEDGWEDACETFTDLFYQGLLEMDDIELSACSDFDHSRIIAAGDDELLEFEKLQESMWNERVKPGCPPSALDAIIEEVLAASLAFLGIKVKAARPKAPQKTAKERPRLRRVA